MNFRQTRSRHTPSYREFSPSRLSGSVQGSSILRSPSRSPQKQQRSVRFLDSEDPIQIQLKNVYEKLKIQPKTYQKSQENSFQQEYPQQRSLQISRQQQSKNPSVQQNPGISKLTHQQMLQSLKLRKNDAPQTSMKRPIKKRAKSVSQSQKPPQSPQLLSYEFRNQDFYSKLHKFYTSKKAEPEKTVKKVVYQPIQRRMVPVNEGRYKPSQQKSAYLSVLARGSTPSRNRRSSGIGRKRSYY